jgi:hypothetical protein
LINSNRAQRLLTRALGAREVNNRLACTQSKARVRAS